jgi:hypothetical protein
MTEVTVDTESIGRKAGRGLGWGLLGNAVGKVGSFATALVLARLLVPYDFGVYAVAPPPSASTCSPTVSPAGRPDSSAARCGM